jgi:hypothetical protein
MIEAGKVGVSCDFVGFPDLFLVDYHNRTELISQRGPEPRGQKFFDLALDVSLVSLHLDDQEIVSV